MFIWNFGEIPTGDVVVTGPGLLSCKYIIHAVGPVWKGGMVNEEQLLKNACINSLKKANSLKI